MSRLTKIALPQEFVSAEEGLQKGASGAFAGVLGEWLIYGGGCNFPDKGPLEGGQKRFYSRIHALRISDAGEVLDTLTLGDLARPSGFGALYLDKGFEVTADFVKKQVVISRKNLECVSRQEEDYKSTFIIRMQKEGTPYLFDYLGETEEAPGEVTHHVALRVGADGVVLSEGSGPSKKAADRMAARIALQLLDAN